MKRGVKMLIAGVGIFLLGLACGIIMEHTDTGDVLGYIMMGLWLIALPLIFLGSYACQNPNGKLPVKKVLVCILVVLAGAALAGVLAAVCSGGSGWIPVGYTVVMAAIPLCLAFAFCLWYWNKK